MRIYTLYHVRLPSIKGRVSEYIKGDLKKERSSGFSVQRWGYGSLSHVLEHSRRDELEIFMQENKKKTEILSTLIYPCKSCLCVEISH